MTESSHPTGSTWINPADRGHSGHPRPVRPEGSARKAGPFCPGRRAEIQLTQPSGAPERQGFAQPPGTQGQQRHRLQRRPSGRALPQQKKGRSEGGHGAGRGVETAASAGSKVSSGGRVSRCCGLHMTVRWQDHDSLFPGSPLGRGCVATAAMLHPGPPCCVCAGSCLSGNVCALPLLHPDGAAHAPGPPCCPPPMTCLNGRPCSA